MEKSCLDVTRRFRILMEFPKTGVGLPMSSAFWDELRGLLGRKQDDSVISTLTARAVSGWAFVVL